MGVRMQWPALPAAVREWVEREFRSAVVTADSQSGGFSPGVAARLVCADGSRAFVKAVGVELNPHTPDLLRTEARVLAALGPSPHRPALRAVYDLDGWAGLLLDDIDGRLPRLPWVPEDLRRVLAAVSELATELTPSPLPAAPRVADQLGDFFCGWRRLAEAPPADLDPWAVRNLDRLAAAEQIAVAALEGGDTLCHIDLRSDNVLLTADRVVLVDWNWAAVGPAWADPLMLGFEAITAGGALPREIREHGPVRALSEELIVAVMAAGAGAFQAMTRTPAPPGLPTIRPWQRRYADALTAWAREHSGWR